MLADDKMKTIKLGFADTFQTAIDFWVDTLGKRYHVERNWDGQPDLLIYSDSNFGTSNKLFNCKKLFYTGENVRPDWNNCDWACTFDHINSPKHYRLPLYVLEMHEMVGEGYNVDYLYTKEIEDPEKLWKERKFCSFVQSNGNVKERNDFFYFLNGKGNGGVDSAGPLFNNVGYILPRIGGHKAKIDFIKNYNYNIAFENGDYPGYVTEKLLNAFYANTVPIYWGSEFVIRDFNPKAFINTNDFYNNQDLVDCLWEYYYKKDAYVDMLTQPCYTNNIVNEYANLDNLLDWFRDNVENNI